MDLNNFQILDTLKVKDALLKIEQNQKGFVCTINRNGSVTGILTDGDIRRLIINEVSINTPIIEVTNTKFLWSKINIPREEILKKLDNVIHFIPVLDENKKLVTIFAKDNLPINDEERVVIKSKSPVRISFAGGGSDTTNYFEKNDGATLNATISIFAHAVLKKRNDNKVIFHSLDLDKSIKSKNLQEFLSIKENFGLIQSVLKMVNPQFGFELMLYSDFKMQSGLGGSSAIVSSILGCFNELRLDQWSDHELVELAFQAERLYYNVAGGWQDQYATVFGGLNFIEFNESLNTVHPLRLPLNIQEELEECLVLCNTNIKHESGDIHLDQKKQMHKLQKIEKVKSNVQIAYKMRNSLLRGELNNFGKLMNQSWKIKRSLSTKISSNYLDNIYTSAIKNGALGGKLLGAGGGGCFLFFIDPFKRNKLVSTLKNLNLEILPLVFENKGLRSWRIRAK